MRGISLIRRSTTQARQMIDTIPRRSYTRAASVPVAVHAAQVLLDCSVYLFHHPPSSAMDPAAMEQRESPVKTGVSLGLFVMDPVGEVKRCTPWG